jgi:hypothetical protein
MHDVVQALGGWHPRRSAGATRRRSVANGTPEDLVEVDMKWRRVLAVMTAIAVIIGVRRVANERGRREFTEEPSAVGTRRRLTAPAL